MTAGRLVYEYVVLRCVPRVDREEFINVGVVLHCQAEDFLGVSWHVDEGRLHAFAPGLDLAAVCDALDVVDGICAGDARGGVAAGAPRSQRFGFLKAPRSTVLQPSPVHGGLTPDPATQLQDLATHYLR